VAFDKSKGHRKLFEVCRPPKCPQSDNIFTINFSFMPFPQLGIRELKWLRRTNDEYETDSLHVLYYFAAKNPVSISVVVLSMIALSAALPN